MLGCSTSRSDLIKPEFGIQGLQIEPTVDTHRQLKTGPVMSRARDRSTLFVRI